MKQEEVTQLVSEAVSAAGVPQDWIPALVELSKRESSWRPNAKNPKSTAYGLFQFLDQTWKNYGSGDRNNPYDQTLAAIAYIKQRYGTPQNALKHWDEKKWY